MGAYQATRDKARKTSCRGNGPGDRPFERPSSRPESLLAAAITVRLGVPPPSSAKKSAGRGAGVLILASSAAELSSRR
jgi:hypothetical protein